MVLNRNMLAFTAMLIMMAATISAVDAQGFNGDKIAFTNFVTRMYDNNPFEGVKVVEDYDDAYLVSVVALDPSRYSSESVMNRVAEVKARAQASRYFNGASITLDMIVTTNEDGNGKVITEMMEKLHEWSFGYVESMELLTTIKKAGQEIYIYSTVIKQ